MENKRLDLQRFAGIEEILENHKEEFGEDTSIKDNFGTISEKLGGLGYEVLINNKKQAEFIPSSRLGEVIGQRDTFKQKVEELNGSLTELQTKAGDNQQLKDDYQNLINKNQTLLADLETTRVNTEIMLGAKDAINAKDLLVFVNMDNIRVNAKGEILGVDAEIERLKLDKPYLFEVDKAARKGGADPGNDDKNDALKLSGMNAMIRKAANR